MRSNLSDHNFWQLCIKFRFRIIPSARYRLRSNAEIGTKALFPKAYCLQSYTNEYSMVRGEGGLHIMGLVLMKFEFCMLRWWMGRMWEHQELVSQKLVSWELLLSGKSVSWEYANPLFWPWCQCLFCFVPNNAPLVESEYLMQNKHWWRPGVA